MKDEPQNRTRRRSLFLRLWMRAMWVKRPQAALGIGSLLVGAAIASLLLNVYSGVERKMTQDFRAFGPNAMLAPASAGGSMLGSDNLISETILGRLASLRQQGAEVESVSMLYSVMRAGKAGAEFDRRSSNLVVAGTDFAAFARMNPDWQPGADHLSAAHSECIVGNEVALRLHVVAGDTLDLAPVIDVGGQANPAAFRVAAIVDTGSSADDQVFLPLPALQHILGLEGKISGAELRFGGAPDQVNEAIHTLQAALPDVDVVPIRQIVYSEGVVLRTVRQLLLLLTILILVIVALCMMAAMTAIILERRKDIAVMKALGASDGLVMRLFLSESAGMGLAGGVLGFLAGALLAQAVALRLFQIHLGVTWWTFPFVCVSSMLLAAVVTLYPVRIVHRIQPAVVLKGE
ncbi:MAG: ABC transporter permease [Terriglobia bacterium]